MQGGAIRGAVLGGWLVRTAGATVAALCLACWFGPQSADTGGPAKGGQGASAKSKPGVATADRGTGASGGAERTVAAGQSGAARSDEGELDPATEITPDEIHDHIEVLASDLFEGREAGTAGERRASAYIIKVLEQSPELQPAGVDGGWLQPFTIKLQGQSAEAHNIIARLPGSDPELSKQYIVVGAHYDHVGYGLSHNSLDGSGEIHNGADDNASGSSTLLDLATSLAGAHWKPRHTVLFQWYSGEELGLLGSRHWVESPLVPLDQTIFMINMDMVGRMVAHTLVVGGTGTSPGLADLARGFCDELGLKMIDDPPGTAPSDNTSFYNHGIPAVFLFTGLHEDYHKASDDAFRINADGAATVGRLAQKLLASIDARDERPAFTLAPGEAYTFRPALYTGAAFVDSPQGPPRVAVVIPGSPAEAAGLREGQIVLELNGEALSDVRTLEARLSAQLDQPRPLRFKVRQPGAAADSEPAIVEVQPIVR
jgi:hypothetical protein